MTANPYRQTVRQKIIGTLRRHGGWMSGMELESKAYEWRSKRIGRTLRDMSEPPSEKNNYQPPSLEKRYSYTGTVEYKLAEGV